MTKHSFLAILLLFSACADKSRPQQQPDHYDLEKPQKFLMPDVLQEISGIAFDGSANELIYAEQDEEGKLFYFKPGSSKISSFKFGKKGDYEDLAIYNGTVFMLRSDGVLFSFPLSDTANEAAPTLHEWKHLLPSDGEYEAMAIDRRSGSLYVLCKKCADDRSDSRVSGYILNGDSNDLRISGNFSVPVPEIAILAGEKKLKFRPSGLARNSQTNEWFIISSVNGLLVITDENWRVKQAIPLSRQLFRQPEGIAFDKKNSLLISNEGNEAMPANILRFNYQQ